MTRRAKRPTREAAPAPPGARLDDREVLRAIATYTYDWESWIDTEGRTKWVNPAVVRLTGRAVDECLAMADYPLSMIYEADRARMRRALEGARAGTSGNDVEFRVRHTDGSLRWCAISWQPITSTTGAPLGYRSSVRDINERKKAEQHLHEAKRKAEEADRAKSEFLAVMSHEIRSPMQAIAGYADLLRLTRLTKKQRGYVDVVLRENRALVKLVDDILDFSALQRGEIKLESVAFDYRALVDSVIVAATPRALAKSLELRAHVARTVPPRVLGDPHRLRQVLVNLVDNAVKFTKAGHVHVHVACEAAAGAGSLILTTGVDDTGVGMRTDTVVKLFEPFQQADSSTAREFGGSGLGLAISKRLCALMGGEIGVVTAPGQGATFTFRVPVRRAAPSRARSAARAGVPVAPRHDRTLAARLPLAILVVDDSPVARDVISELLRALGYAPDVAASGREAVEQVTRRRYDLVLLDMQMPEMDGRATAKAIRAQGRGPRPRVVVLTANAFTRPMADDPESGIDAVVYKPLELEGLATCIRSVAEANRDGAAPAEENATHEAATKRLPQIPVLDPLVIGDLQSVRGRDGAPLLASVGRRVAAEGREVLAKLETALQAGDAARLADAAHRLKGLALLVGARRVAAEADALVSAGRERGGPAKRRTASTAALVGRFDEALAALARHTGKPV